MDNDYIKSIRIMKEQLEAISKPLKIVDENFIKLGTCLDKNSLKPLNVIVPSFQPIINNFYSFIMIKNQVKMIQVKLHELQEKLSTSKIKSRINAAQVEKLNQFYWIIPFDIEYENLDEILKIKENTEFDKFIIEHFNNDRVKKIIGKIMQNFQSEDKKELMKQIEEAYLNKSYALCITCLITLIDGLSLDLIEPGSEFQHLSYKAINSLLEYIDDAPINEFGYELYLKVCILNNFYIKLYENETTLKNNNKEKLSRHLNSHGVKYSNNKIDCLRVLNAIYFGQEVLQEIDMQDKFFRKKNDKKFSVKK